MVRQLHAYLMNRGVEIAFGRVASSLRSDLIRHRLLEVIGPRRIYDHLHDAVAASAANAVAIFSRDER